MTTLFESGHKSEKSECKLILKELVVSESNETNYKGEI